MKERELKHILQKDYNFEENWKPVLKLMFNSKIDYLAKPSNPFFEEKKVISGKQIGAIKLDDNKSLAIFEVEVDDSIRIDQNRKGLRDIAAKHIDQNITHGALVFFFSKNQTDYRFSFIAKWSDIDLETGDFIKGETKPKRYTYLLGGNESCTTAAKRILELASKKDKGEKIDIDKVKETFSVEPLKKDFFKSYKEHYEKFWRYIANPEYGFRDILLDTSKEKESDQEKPIRDFVKKLLGRIVFLHFLQKKGWMGCPANSVKWENGEKQFLSQLYNDFEDKEKFHSQCLTNLFFNTLNTRRENDIFEIEGLSGKLNGSRVPYLNGGLFEKDKPLEVLDIDFPVKYFDELFDFFAQYNFTIDENSPDDHEVGIDPEMLGHIFENLLEENREKGAFYTPKEIVEYMCKESTIQYLKNHFPEEAQIENFVRNHQVSNYFTNDKDNALKLNEKLDVIKICDPAIGSGAFPIGILHELFEAKKFIYPHLNTIEPFNPAQVKKNIIQNSIYGVDIEKGAVDIAQLRFWLALVVDETSPQPLPNLDYKIMQGNSLLESYEGIDLSEAAFFEEPKVRIVQTNIFEDSKADYGFSEEKRADIKKLIKDYFNVGNKDKKTRIHKAIDKIVIEHIDKSLEFYENKLLIEIANYKSALAHKKSINQRTEKIEKEISKREKQLISKIQARQKLLEYEKTEERPYFLWHLYFMDVFEQGGFDIMIGNPPYIQLQKDKGYLANLYKDKKFETFTRSGDIYMLFYEKGRTLLKEKGILSYITSNSWMKAKYGTTLRKYFVETTNPIKLLNFEDTQLFPSATVEVNILIFKNERFESRTESVAIKQDAINKPIDTYFHQNKIIINNFDETEWIILSKKDFIIKLLIEKNKKLLKECNYKIISGVKTGLNEAFLINVETKNRLIKLDVKNKEIIKPIIRGRDITKYSYVKGKSYCIYSHNGNTSLGIQSVNIAKDFPTIFSYLESFGEKIFRRPSQGKEWYNVPTNYLPEFNREKIIWGELSDNPKFSYDENKSLTEATVFNLVGDNVKFLLTILNSYVCYWYFETFTTTSGMGTNRWKKYKLEKIPIPQLKEKERKPFEILADYLTLINDPEIPYLFESISTEIVSRFFEDVLNMMVYELYFEEHMKENKIDVLQFVDFEDISQLKKFEEKRDVIQREYYKLKEKDNPIRNRILVSNVRSWIIKRINESTH